MSLAKMLTYMEGTWCGVIINPGAGSRNRYLGQRKSRQSWGGSVRTLLASLSPGRWKDREGGGNGR